MAITGERARAVLRDGIEDLEHYRGEIAPWLAEDHVRRCVESAIEKVYRMQEVARRHVPTYFDLIDNIEDEAGATVGGLVAVRGADVHSAIGAHGLGALYPGRIYPSDYLYLGQNWVWEPLELPAPPPNFRDRRANYNAWLAEIPIPQTLGIAQRFFADRLAELPR